MPDIRLQRLGNEFRISTTAEINTNFTGVVAREGGGFTAAYNFSEAVSNSGQIRARTYTIDGQPFDNDFRVTFENGRHPFGLAPVPGGGWAVASTSGGTGVTMPQPLSVYQALWSSQDVEIDRGAVIADGDVKFCATVTALADGNHVVVWLTTAGAVKGHIFDSDNAPVGAVIPVTTDAVPSFTASSGTAPVVTGLADGGFAVAWTTTAGEILAQRFDAAGTAAGGQINVNTLTAGSQIHPGLAGLSSGGFVAVWTSNAADPGTPIATNGDVKGQLFDASGVPVGGEFLIGDVHVNRQSQPRVAAVDGGFIVTWSDNSATGNNDGLEIKAQAFADDGTPLGGEFQVNAPDARLDDAPSVVGLADGNIVFVWRASVSGIIGTPLYGQLVTWVTDYAGTAGDDALGGSLGNDHFTPGAGVDHVRGFAGRDRVDYSTLGLGLEINLAAGWSWDGASMDFLTEIEDATGSALNDYITGTHGDNILDGGPGGTDVINGLGGNDTISYQSAVTAVTIDLDQQNSWDGVTMDFLSSIENAIGSSFSDYILGSSGDNILDGGAGGTDYLIGGGGFDTATYRNSSSALQIYLDLQLSWDGVTVDFLGSIERGIGSRFDDTLVANDAGSTLNGWVGNDNLFGGAGADVFEFLALDRRMDLGDDRVFGFQLGSDTIAIGNDTGYLHSFADVLAHALQDGADTLIRYNDQSTIRLVGIGLDDLTASDFQFVG